MKCLSHSNKTSKLFGIRSNVKVWTLDTPNFPSFVLYRVHKEELGSHVLGVPSLSLSLSLMVLVQTKQMTAGPECRSAVW